MTSRSRSIENLPSDAKLFVGKRGGVYFIENDRRVYVVKNYKKPTRKYTAPRGAFKRYLESTMN